MEELAGRVAVVTGAASGMGRSFALRFARAGMHVVLADVEEPRLDAAVAEVAGVGGGDALGVVTDVSDGEAMDRLAAETFDRFDAAHVVCLNAGVGAGGPTWELSTRDWEWVLGVNLWGVIHGLRVFLPRLVDQDEGHVVTTASIAGLTSHPQMGPYNASKHAVVTITETLYHELAQHAPGVGVSCLCPGLVNTGILESDRNRPEPLRNTAPRQRTAGEEERRAAIFDVYKAALGPDDVAEMVLDAVVERRFWVLTDGAHDHTIAARHADIQARRNPEVNPGLFG